MLSMESSRYFSDYYWKGGIPRGKAPVDKSSQQSYKIVSDPYYKRISIESYRLGVFDAIIYDSAALDFRHLKQVNMSNWEKTTIFESEEKIICLIRNQDDRILYQEVYHFEQDLCRSCTVMAPQGHILSKQRIFYTSLKDAFNGVVLSDSNNHPVMFKLYEIDSASNAFTDLLKEEWNLEVQPIFLPQRSQR